MTDDRPVTPARPERAGWFEDPDDPEQLRYFDGILWTKNTTPRRTIWTRTETPGATSAPVAPSVGTEPAPTATSQPTGPYGYPQAPVGPPTAQQDPQQQWPPPQSAQPNAYGASAYQPGHAAGPHTADGAPLASIPARLAAWLLDSMITWTVGLVIGGPLFWLGLGNYPQVVAEALRAGSTDAAALAERIQFDMVWIGAFAVVQLIIGVGYHTLFLSRTGATPGKRVAGISVRLAERPGVLSGADALRRSALRPALWLFTYTPVISLFAMPLSVFDAVSALWDPKRQTLHDKIGRTVVVRGPQERRSR
ncbi:MAG: RDD family protein [Intrasporangiaceae bacterium]|nr:RDD family protein [Intrasporangiaceae bacterium]